MAAFWGGQQGPHSPQAWQQGAWPPAPEPRGQWQQQQQQSRQAKGAPGAAEQGHAAKRARTEPHAPQPSVDQAQLYALQTSRQATLAHGGGGKHSGKHRQHKKGGKAGGQQPQQVLPSLPTAENYLDAYPGVKDLIKQFKHRGVEQSPLAVVNEYAARMMQQVAFDMRQESLSGGFRVEARLVGKRSPEPLETGVGRARNKQVGKQVAAAALLERLLESGTVDAQSLLDPNAGEKAPKKWEPPQKPGLGLDPAVLSRGGGAHRFGRFGHSSSSRAPAFVRGGTIVPGEGGFTYCAAGRGGSSTGRSVAGVGGGGGIGYHQQQQQQQPQWPQWPQWPVPKAPQQPQGPLPLARGFFPQQQLAAPCSLQQQQPQLPVLGRLQQPGPHLSLTNHSNAPLVRADQRPAGQTDLQQQQRKRSSSRRRGRHRSSSRGSSSRSRSHSRQRRRRSSSSGGGSRGKGRRHRSSRSGSRERPRRRSRSRSRAHSRHQHRKRSRSRGRSRSRSKSRGKHHRHRQRSHQRSGSGSGGRRRRRDRSRSGSGERRQRRRRHKGRRHSRASPSPEPCYDSLSPVRQASKEWGGSEGDEGLGQRWELFSDTPHAELVM